MGNFGGLRRPIEFLALTPRSQLCRCHSFWKEFIQRIKQLCFVLLLRPEPKARPMQLSTVFCDLTTVNGSSNRRPKPFSDQTEKPYTWWAQLVTSQICARSRTNCA